MTIQLKAANRLHAAKSVPFHKYVPDKEAHSKLPLPPGKWEQVERQYMDLNKYEVASKGNKLEAVLKFYEKLGYKVTGRTDKGDYSNVKLKSPDPKLRLQLHFNEHRDNRTSIEFTMLNKTSAAILAGRETGEGAGALFYCPGTNRFLILLRNDDGDDGNVWCCLGGGRDLVNGVPEPLETTVRREAWEEAGLPMDAKYELVPVGTKYYEDGFRFHNYLAVIPEEFLPMINEEHKSFQWIEWADFPKEMHQGMMSVFNSPDGQRVLHHYTDALDHYLY